MIYLCSKIVRIRRCAAIMFLGLAVQPSAQSAPAAEALVKHVVVIGVDGLCPAGIRDAETPTFDELCRHNELEHACPRRDAHQQQPQLGLDDHGRWT